MWRRLTAVVCLIAVGSVTAGCAAALVGAGAAAGYVISKDSVTSHFDLTKEEVFGQSVDVAHQMGQVVLEDEKHGIIKAKIGDVNVTINVKPVSRKTVQLKVKARNTLLLPKVDVAQDVYNKISQRLL